MSSPLRSASGVLGVRVAGAALQLALLGVCIAFFPPEQVGLSGMLWSAVVLARVGGSLGLDLAGLRDVPSLLEAEGREAAAASAAADVRLATLVLGPPLLLLSVVMAVVPGLGGATRELLVVLPVAVMLSVWQRLMSAHLRAFGSVYLSQALDALLLPVVAIALAVVASTRSDEHLVLSQVLALLLVAAVTHRAWPGRGARPAPRRALREYLPLGVGSSIAALASRSPIFLVGATSAVQAAVFDVGQRFFSAAALASLSAASVFLPRVSLALRAGETVRLRRELVQHSGFSAAPGAILVVLLLAVGPDAMGDLLGEAYEDAWTVAVVLSAAAALNGLTGLCSGLLAMAGWNRAFVTIASVQLVLVLVGGVLWGSTGATAMAVVVLVLECARGVALVVVTEVFFRKQDAGAAVAHAAVHDGEGR